MTDDDRTTDGDLAQRAEALRDRYRTTLGAVPHGAEDRLHVARTLGRLHTEEAFMTLRHIVLTDNPLGARVQQLVHFGQLLALGRPGPARIHARGALHAGAELAELAGVAETALITSGTPAYALGIEIISELLRGEEDTAG
ncbi:carboxymuconolactone decarboxylase family protein [Streptomyces kaniharaensis]|uniref:Carboxymuconolactone decarboxylase family protein n=1 Tax=Streptomyces kaniharaensis TaxID=212423 RepID=A0A6N7L283_9ACTN|nr:carboxymuconolactone decarboxylase family protein [Streptomyces kaniharaensis]MQS16618.1 carboxymuconolactone decarboxylase family protein [Streptomyces kaniharaensis]